MDNISNLVDIESLPDNIKDLLDSEDSPPIDVDEDNSIEGSDEEINTDNVLDKPEIDAILEDKIDEKSSEQPEFDKFLNTLPQDKQGIYRHAAETGWDYGKWKAGKGKSAEVWVYTEPYIKSSEEHKKTAEEYKRIAEEQSRDLKELRTLITNTIKESHVKNKEHAEELIKDANARLVAANESKDWDEGEAAYRQLQNAKKALEESEKHLSSIKNEPEAWKPTPAYQQEINRAGKTFAYNNRDWLFPKSPNHDPEKVKLAQELEIKLINENPGIDPDLLYIEVQLEIDKLSKPTATKETSQPSAARKPALIENTSSVRSAEYKTSKSSGFKQDLIAAIAELKKLEPGTAERLIDMNKIKGLK